MPDGKPLPIELWIQSGLRTLGGGGGPAHPQPFSPRSPGIYALQLIGLSCLLPVSKVSTEASESPHTRYTRGAGRQGAERAAAGGDKPAAPVRASSSHGHKGGPDHTEGKRI